MLDHDYGIGSVRNRRAGHNCHGLSGLKREARRRSTSFNLASEVQIDRQLLKIGSSNSITIASGPRKRWEIAIGVDRLGKHPSLGIQKPKQFSAFGPQARGMVLDHGTCFLKAQNAGWFGLGGHADDDRRDRKEKRGCNGSRFCNAELFG